MASQDTDTISQCSLITACSIFSYTPLHFSPMAPIKQRGLNMLISGVCFLDLFVFVRYPCVLLRFLLYLLVYFVFGVFCHVFMCLCVFVRLVRCFTCETFILVQLFNVGMLSAERMLFLLFLLFLLFTCAYRPCVMSC